MLSDFFHESLQLVLNISETWTSLGGVGASEICYRYDKSHNREEQNQYGLFRFETNQNSRKVAFAGGGGEAITSQITHLQKKCWNKSFSALKKEHLFL